MNPAFQTEGVAPDLRMAGSNRDQAAAGRLPQATTTRFAPAGAQWEAWCDAVLKREPFRQRVAVVVAHPDDEVIGIGAQLPRLESLTLIHVTDGAPRNLFDAQTAGFQTREAYAAARGSELEKALTLAGRRECPRLDLGCVDQESSLHLSALTHKLLSVVKGAEFDLVLTHPYEGGHPDHDSTAFAVQTACRLLARSGNPVPCLLEMASYHNRDGRMAVAEFLPEGRASALNVTLTAEEQELKEQLLSCFFTQRQTLSAFSRIAECFRPAPVYDFRQPPHPGPLYYELFDWGMTGARWRDLAQATLKEFGLTDLV